MLSHNPVGPIYFCYELKGASESSILKIIPRRNSMQAPNW